MPNIPLRLENRLILFRFFCNLFGAEKTEDFQSILHETNEGYDAEDGHSSFLAVLRERKGVLIPRDRLNEYDDNIKAYLNQINAGRSESITLKYFQYLPLLFTEIYLDRYFDERETFLAEINAFIDVENGRTSDLHYPHFALGDLNKLALWMATGSGKTLLMHINYLQFLRYSTDKLDNIILLTPNEGLSGQHLEEMQKSGIPCSLLIDGADTLFTSGNKVRVVEITKLTAEKKGEGVSIDVSSLEGNNLLFVDEGHKGTKSDEQKWRKLREAVGGRGFTFEYSATFGQAVNSARDEELLREYSQSMLFDYSYRFFYNDGYGKDYTILNLTKDFNAHLTDVLMLGNLLSFYQQRLYFEEHREQLRPYNIEPPLWIFVGGKVQGKTQQSDVYRILEFIVRFMKNNRGWVQKDIEKILKGESQLNDDNGHDVFKDRFKYLLQRKRSPDGILRSVLETVFHTKSGSAIRLGVLKNADGEIGLRAGSDEKYFGVINIGDTSEFLKLVEEKHLEVSREDDVISPSLFNDISKPQSTVNMLIGAKKFIEGWSSWRVSTMGLMNIGTGEGTQIIQLFGRGVRLLGKNRSLKRTQASDASRPENIQLLETLAIFGLRANYMASFRDYMRENGGQDEWEKIQLEIWPNESFFKYGLVLPAIKKGKEFCAEDFLTLKPDPKIKPSIDLLPRIQITESQRRKLTVEEGVDAQMTIPQNYLPLLNWDRVYFSLLDHKSLKGYWNVHVPREVLRTIILSGYYTLYCPTSLMDVKTFDGLRKLEDIVVVILKKYLDKFYVGSRKKWEDDNREAIPLVKEGGNFVPYTISVKRGNTDLIERIQNLVKQMRKKFKQDESANGLKFIHFDRHLYQPLLRLKTSDHIKVDPTALDEGGGEGEGRFIDDLKTYVKEHRQELLGKHIFVLRNLPHRGIGFYDTTYFYPDFIIWIKEKKKQRIIFVDPKGLLHFGPNHPKLNLHNRLKDIQPRLRKPDVSLDSFIISTTSIESLVNQGWNRSAEEWAVNHVLFQADIGYLNALFT